MARDGPSIPMLWLALRKSPGMAIDVLHVSRHYGTAISGRSNSTICTGIGNVCGGIHGLLFTYRRDASWAILVHSGMVIGIPLIRLDH